MSHETASGAGDEARDTQSGGGAFQGGQESIPPRALVRSVDVNRLDGNPTRPDVRSPFGSDHTAQFGEHATIDQQGDTIYIYDHTKSRRYVVRQYEIPTVGVHGNLELQGQTSGGTWNTLMGGYENRAPVTGERLDSGIVVDTIDVHRRSKSISAEPTTPGVTKGYSTQGGGVQVEHAGFGYYGQPQDVAEDLRKLDAVAETSKDLPKIIDVPATVQRLADNFQQGIFEPPQFVLPIKSVKGAVVSKSLLEKGKSVIKALRKDS